MCTLEVPRSSLLMPTVKDRVQVLLAPQEYADLQLLCKEERRSAGMMGAILIEEAIAARRLNGTFVPEKSESEEAMEIAKLRRTAKQLGKGVNELIEKEEKEKGSELDAKDLLKAMQALINNQASS